MPTLISISPEQSLLEAIERLIGKVNAPFKILQKYMKKYLILKN